jgi:hypothetical protein
MVQLWIPKTSYAYVGEGQSTHVAYLLYLYAHNLSISVNCLLSSLYFPDRNLFLSYSFKVLTLQQQIVVELFVTAGFRTRERILICRG